MRRPRSDKEETRRRILETAGRLFREKGYNGVGLDAVMAEAGLTAGAFYFHFDSKEALVMAFYQRASDEMAPRIEAALAEVKGFEKRLSAILAVKFEYFEPNRSFLGALLRHAADPAHPGKQVLTLTGTANNDSFLVQPTNSNGAFTVTFNGADTLPFDGAGISRLITEKYLASGWCAVIAAVDCSGTSWYPAVSDTSIVLSASSKRATFSWSSICVVVGWPAVTDSCGNWPMNSSIVDSGSRPTSSA